MKKNENNKFIILEKDNNIKIIIPPPRFNNPMTKVLIVINLMLVIPVAVIAYGIYYAETVYKLGLIFFNTLANYWCIY